MQCKLWPICRISIHLWPICSLHPPLACPCCFDHKLPAAAVKQTCRPSLAHNKSQRRICQEARGPRPVPAKTADLMADKLRRTCVSDRTLFLELPTGRLGCVLELCPPCPGQ
jgi:hypothetical protein